MVEGERSAFVVTLDHESCEFFVLLENNRQVFFCDSGRTGRICNDRFHGELVKSEVQHLPDIVYEINVVVGKGTSHVVAEVTSLSYELLEVRNDPVVRAVACIVNTEAVVYFFTSVQGKNDIVHFPVGKLGYFVVQKDTVGSKSKTDILVMDLFLLASVCNELFADIPVHEGLAAEEVDIKVLVEA